MAGDWSEDEVSRTVEDYFTMLRHELSGEAYSKAEHNRELRAVLQHRSGGAVEFKHANISAVLIELGFPYIDGYKPRRNYQERLRVEVAERLAREPALAALAESIVSAPLPESVTLPVNESPFVPAPVRAVSDVAREQRYAAPPTPLRINYLEREARNSALGAAGEQFALQAEHWRLWTAGHRRLADRIEQVSITQGDGLGYDIRSFNDDGSDRLIEVKTTNFGSMTPFFASAREVQVSADLHQQYQIYRIFQFRKSPKIFSLPGSMWSSCQLDPAIYRASVP